MKKIINIKEIYSKSDQRGYQLALLLVIFYCALLYYLCDSLYPVYLNEINSILLKSEDSLIFALLVNTRISKKYYFTFFFIALVSGLFFIYYLVDNFIIPLIFYTKLKCPNCNCKFLKYKFGNPIKLDEVSASTCVECNYQFNQ